VRVNCAAIPESLFESELFGYVRGAFTGALNDRPGRFEAAQGGTLMLDETARCRWPHAAQAPPRAAGEGVRARRRDAAAANRCADRRRHQPRPGREVLAGRFRGDLFYRLNVFPIAIPPLRERLEDVPRLTRHFVMLCASKMGKSIESISEQAVSKLTAYSWPGNVRELQNVIERAVILSPSRRLELDEVLPSPVAGGTTIPGESLEHVERDHILAVLESVGWRVSGDHGAASILGLKRTTLEARMRKLGISRP
jgi:transcriptional regulator with GAF, ATPase, and Fis domain